MGVGVQPSKATHFSLKWYEKCVLIGYSFVKKAYKLFSLDNKNVLFSRDVGFNETVFPFKMRNKIVNDGADVDFTSEVNHLTFFDNQMSTSPYDEGTASSVEEGDYSLSEGNVSNSSTSLDDSAPNSRRNLNTDVQPSVRRFSRSGKMLAKFNDYVVESNVKYGLEKHVNYSKLDPVNFCFATTLNKSVEPKTYYEAIKDNNWVEAMNNEIQALNRNNT
ncbi:ribonuclease H-like domain-containing protein [Tanacetum coccineum]|uniref:Ribonuclease H-like domain-containing protein n=1 Tax=Tanacetum coccineum TaxID=301880 RepID=A0ABQ5CIV8_9ASTR